MQKPDAQNQWAELWAGMRDTLPLVVGATPFGLVYGALAVNIGLSPAGTLAMSAFVFAGSAQFIAIGLINSGLSPGMIILTTLIVNLRHLLYGASLAPYVKGLSQRWLAPLGFWLTDETYMVTIARYNKADGSPYKQWYFLGSALFMYSNWQLWTYVGLRAGQAIPDPSRWGLDFAMVVTFIGMLVPYLHGRPALIAALVAGGSALIFNPLPNRLGLIVAVLMGVGAGVLSEMLDPGASGKPSLTDPEEAA